MNCRLHHNLNDSCSPFCHQKRTLTNVGYKVQQQAVKNLAYLLPVSRDSARSLCAACVRSPSCCGGKTDAHAPEVQYVSLNSTGLGIQVRYAAAPHCTTAIFLYSLSHLANCETALGSNIPAAEWH